MAEGNRKNNKVFLIVYLPLFQSVYLRCTSGIEEEKIPDEKERDLKNEGKSLIPVENKGDLQGQQVLSNPLEHLDSLNFNIDLKSLGFTPVRVRVPLPAPGYPTEIDIG